MEKTKPFDLTLEERKQLNCFQNPTEKTTCAGNCTCIWQDCPVATFHKGAKS